MMIVKEAKIWLKCFLQFLHDLICDFFALYLSQYRLNKLFLHNLLLWFSFYVQISYSNSSSPFFSLVLFYRFPSNFHFLQSLYLQYNCIQPCDSLFILFFRTIISCNFSFLTFTQIYYNTTSFFECYFSYLVKDILCQKQIYYATIREVEDTHYDYFNIISGPLRSANFVTLTLSSFAARCVRKEHISSNVINVL